MQAIARGARLSRVALAGRPRPRTATLVRGELRKLAGQRGTWPLLGISLALALVLALAIERDSGAEQALSSHPQAYLAGVTDVLRTALATVVGVVLLVVSARSVAMEYEAGTVRVVLSRGVGRLQLLAAKLGALTLAALLLLACLLPLSALLVAILVQSQAGTVAPLASLSWRDVQVDLLTLLLSAGTCILAGAAAGAAGRSLAFGIAGAVGLFPADHGLAYLCQLAAQASGDRRWNELTGCLLGPNLDHLPSALTGRTADFLGTLAVQAGAGHCLFVVGAYALLLGSIAVVPTWLRDVVE